MNQRGRRDATNQTSITTFGGEKKQICGLRRYLGKRSSTPGNGKKNSLIRRTEPGRFSRRGLPESVKVFSELRRISQREKGESYRRNVKTVKQNSYKERRFGMLQETTGRRGGGENENFLEIGDPTQTLGEKGKSLENTISK